MNSVAVLMPHLAGVLHEGMAIALGDPPGWVRAEEYETRGVVSTEMLRRLDVVIDYARSALFERRALQCLLGLAAIACALSPRPGTPPAA